MKVHRDVKTRANERGQAPEVLQNACTVFAEGDHLYAAMLEDISKATKCIRLESYILACDEVGLSFASVLAERARAGVDVKVHLDGVGAMLEGTELLVDYLQARRVSVRWFNRWRWRSPLHYNRRNHRKLLVVDDTSLFVGGFNIHRKSAMKHVGEVRWRDVHVRLNGKLLKQARQLFDDAWVTQLVHRVPEPDGLHRLVPNGTRSCRRVLHCLFLDAINSARRSVLVATPYFVPDYRFRAALVLAAKRGVDVRVLLPAKSDQRLVRWASRALARRLIHKGVSIFLFQPRMLHSKVMLVDYQWVTIGSANTDYRSFFTNLELNYVTRDPLVCQRIGTVLDEDFKQALPMTLTNTTGGPMRWLAEKFARWLRRWL